MVGYRQMLGWDVTQMAFCLVPNKVLFSIFMADRSNFRKEGFYMGSWFKGIQPITVQKGLKCGPMVGGTLLQRLSQSQGCQFCSPVTSLPQEAHRRNMSKFRVAHKQTQEIFLTDMSPVLQKHWDRKCAWRVTPAPTRDSRL